MRAIATLSSIVVLLLASLPRCAGQTSDVIWSVDGGLGSPLSDLAWLPDDSGFITASGQGYYAEAGGAERWDRQSGLPITMRSSSDATVVACSRDGRYIAGSGFSMRTTIWDARTGALLRRIGRSASALAFSPDGARIAVGGYGWISLWSVDGTDPIWQIRSDSTGSSRINSISFSPDGRALLAPWGDGSIRLLRADDGSLLRIFTGPCPSYLPYPLLSPDGSFVAAICHESGTISLWDPATGAPSGSISAPDIASVPLSCSADGRYMAAVIGSGYDSIRVWEMATRAQRTYAVSATARCIALSSTGDQLLVGTFEKDVRRYDLSTGAEVQRYIANNGPAYSLAASPDGKYVASAGGDPSTEDASGDRGVIVRDGSAGRPVAFLDGPRSNITSLAFSPDGSRLAAASNDSTIRIWRAGSWGLERSIVGASWHAGSIAFSPNGARIAASNGTTVIWDVATGSPVGSLEGRSGSTVVAYSPDGSLIASAEQGGASALKLWDAYTGSLVRTVTTYGNHYNPRIAFSPDGSLLALSLSDSPSIQLWSVTDGTLRRSLSGSTGPLRSIAISSDGSRLAAAGDDGSIRLWEASTGNLLGTFSGHTGGVQSIRFSPDDRTLLSGGRDGTVRLWQVSSGTELSRLAGYSDWVYAVAFSPDGSRIVTAGGDGKARILDAASGATLSTLEGHRSWVLATAISPDGRLLATGGGDRTIRLWNLSDGSLRATLIGHRDAIRSLAFTSDSKRLASGSYGEIRVWNAESGDSLALHRGSEYWINALSFADGDSSLIAAGNGPEIDVWRGDSSRSFYGIQGRVHSLALSSDGGRLYCAGDNGSITALDLADGGRTGPSFNAVLGIQGMQFSRDGAHLVTAGGDGMVRVWNVADGTIARSYRGESAQLALALGADSLLLTSSHTGAVTRWETSGWRGRTRGSGGSGAFARPDAAGGEERLATSARFTARAGDSAATAALFAAGLVDAKLGEIASGIPSEPADTANPQSTIDDGMAEAWTYRYHSMARDTIVTLIATRQGEEVQAVETARSAALPQPIAGAYVPAGWIDSDSAGHVFVANEPGISRRGGRMRLLRQDELTMAHVAIWKFGADAITSDQGWCEVDALDGAWLGCIFLAAAPRESGRPARPIRMAITPNPASSEAIVRVSPVDLLRGSVVEICTPLGDVVYRSGALTGSPDGILAVPLGGLADGIYLVRLLGADAPSIPLVIRR